MPSSGTARKGYVRPPPRPPGTGSQTTVAAVEKVHTNGQQSINPPSHRYVRRQEETRERMFSDFHDDGVLRYQQKSIGIFSVISIMGYGLLPIVVLAAIAITISLKYVCTLSQLVPHSRSWFDFVGCAPQGLLWTSSRVRGGRLGHSHRRPLL